MSGQGRPTASPRRSLPEGDQAANRVQLVISGVVGERAGVLGSPDGDLGARAGGRGWEGAAILQESWGGQLVDRAVFLPGAGPVP